MALIGKIRNNMWLVFVIIGLATVSFILMDAMGSGGGPTTVTPVGVIDGEKVTNIEFERAYQTLFSNAGDPNVSRSALWDYFVEEKIVQSETEDLGMHVSKEELMDLQFGQNISPIVYQSFLNPQTGQLDLAQLQSIRQSIESGEPMSAQFRQFWAEQEKQVIKTQLQTKLNGLVGKAIYSPNWLALNSHNERNATVDMAVVKIPFDNIPSDDVQVTDQDIESYVNENRHEFEMKEEMREVAFVSMDVLPTGFDSTQWLEEMQGFITEFRNTDNDSLYAVNHNGIISNRYLRAEEIDDFYQDKLATFQAGGVYGPYNILNSYQAVKLLDKRVVPDSVKVRHILKTATPGVQTQLDAANFLIDSLMGAMGRPTAAKFAELAETYSDDVNTKSDGGSLGTIYQGAMVPTFDEVCFLTGREGNVYKVNTQFGVHLLYIEDQIYNDRLPKYQMAYINVPIIPTKQTQDEKYEEMIEIVSQYPYLDEFKAVMNERSDLRVERSGNLAVNDFTVGSLGSGSTSRDIVKWAFDGDTDINDISPSVFTYTDPVNYFNNRYVIVGLEAIRKPGLPKAADMRDQLEFVVMNKKKAESFVNSLTVSDLSSLATAQNVEVDTLLNVNLGDNFVLGLGAEPEVVGTAFGQEVGQISQPIIGNSGVIVVQTVSSNEASGDVSDIGFIRNTLNGEALSQIQFKIVEALRDKVKIKDNRSIFY